MEISLCGGGAPTPGDLELRQTLQHLMAERGLGEVVEYGSCQGRMYLCLEGAGPAFTVQAVQAALTELPPEALGRCHVVGASPERRPAGRGLRRQCPPPPAWKPRA
ncbi:MAG: hypothetical protein QME94_14345 [Anaerolineae bacterium]|nr:hypothetical protein [Anaerolineae bacterium]